MGLLSQGRSVVEIFLLNINIIVRHRTCVFGVPAWIVECYCRRIGRIFRRNTYTMITFTILIINFNYLFKVIKNSSVFKVFQSQKNSW